MATPVLFPVIIVKQYERMVPFRLGKFFGLKGAGLRLLIPFIDSFQKVDLREDVIDVARQTNITKDNAPIDIDFLIYYKVVDHEAEKSVLEVQDFRAAIVGMATTTLRAVVGDIPLDDVLAKREEINQVLRVKLDEVTGRWGVKVTAVEIREIDPPAEIQHAMNRQMAAERERRAVVTEADGQRQANITVAEGQKQAAILNAEGQRQSEILKAEGNRQAAILNAEGFSNALDQIYKVASGVDSKTMSLQYFETLKDIGSSPSTKFIFPMEFTNVLKPFMNLAASGQEESSNGTT